MLEEEHYKAQERIQSLINVAEQPLQTEKPIENASKTTSLFPCDQCTKNFLTADSLKSHQRRKHSETSESIAEKHERSDSSEKPKDIKENETVAEPNGNTQSEPKSLKEQINSAEREILQLNNNNNDDEPNANCATCLKKSKVDSTTVGIQCEVEISKKPSNSLEVNVVNEKGDCIEIEAVSSGDEIAINAEGDKKYVFFLDFERLIVINLFLGDVKKDVANTQNTPAESQDQTIIELKREIAELQNALKVKTVSESKAPVASDLPESKTNVLQQTSGKIDVIEQKFCAFESMYMKSQSDFIESFRHLDERQKDYMNNITQTIKDIVEQSLGSHDTCTIPEKSSKHEIDVENKTVKTSTETKENGMIDHEEKLDHKEMPVEQIPNKVDQPKISPQIPEDLTSEMSSCSDENENDVKETVCQADIHHNESDSSEESSDDGLSKTQQPITMNKETIKEAAVSDLENRLSQLGVDAESIGIPTPRSQQVHEDLAEEREEMKKVNKVFFFEFYFISN